jgi:hypothetical protein
MYVNVYSFMGTHLTSISAEDFIDAVAGGLIRRSKPSSSSKGCFYAAAIMLTVKVSILVVELSQLLIF